MARAPRTSGTGSTVGRRLVDVDEAGLDEDRKILREAKERFKRAQGWEGDVRKLYIDDVKFANGDSDNGWQWPDNVKEDRDVNNRPCLTVNKTKVIINKLANEAKQNPPEPRVKPVGDKVSFKAAEVWEDLVRHIMYVSNGQSLLGIAKENQLEGGIGNWHITHDFEDDRSWNQEIYLKPLDPMNVYLDCDIKQVDGSDAMWGFIFEDYDRKEFERLFPNVRLPAASPGLNDKDDWIRTNAVRTAEYYRIKITEETLLYVEDDRGVSWTGLESELPPGPEWRAQFKAYEVGKEGADFRKRKVKTRQLQWYKIAGDEIIERREDLKGKYVPIIREPGRERKIDGKLYRAGLVRALKDPQRMYNYNTSGEVEVVALQSKTPWIVAAAAIEGNETAWANANTTNSAYLTYRHIDDEGNELPAPTRIAAPTPAEGFIEGIRIAAAELEMASGMAQAQQVNPSLERTPKAIDERMRTGEVTNWDFTHNEMLAIRHTCVVIMDLAPHIYDTARVCKIRAKDGTISEIVIDPDADEAYRSEPQPGSEDESAVKVLFNPKIGKYAIEADVGPAYQTQRQAAWDAFVQIITHSPELIAQIGDLGFLAADFPLAQQIAERLKRGIEHTMPWLLQDSQVGPIVQKLQQELENSQSQVAELLEKLSEARIRSRGKDELRDLEAMDADDKRLTTVVDAMKTLHDMGIDRHELLILLRKTEHEMDHDVASLEIEKSNRASVKQKQTTGA